MYKSFRKNFLGKTGISAVLLAAACQPEKETDVTAITTEAVMPPPRPAIQKQVYLVTRPEADTFKTMALPVFSPHADEIEAQADASFHTLDSIVTARHLDWNQVTAFIGEYHYDLSMQKFERRFLYNAANRLNDKMRLQLELPYNMNVYHQILPMRDKIANIAQAAQTSANQRSITDANTQSQIAALGQYAKNDNNVQWLGLVKDVRVRNLEIEQVDQPHMSSSAHGVSMDYLVGGLERLKLSPNMAASRLVQAEMQMYQPAKLDAMTAHKNILKMNEATSGYTKLYYAAYIVRNFSMANATTKTPVFSMLINGNQHNGLVNMNASVPALAASAKRYVYIASLSPNGVNTTPEKLVKNAAQGLDGIDPAHAGYFLGREEIILPASPVETDYTVDKAYKRDSTILQNALTLYQTVNSGQAMPTAQPGPFIR